MAESILLLRLEGPVQSWGTRSRWDVRDTGLEPTKSGIVGLIGCAMGLDRHNRSLEHLDRVLLFGVRSDRAGVLSRDFHTVTGYHRTAAGDFKHSGGTAKSLAKAREYGEVTVVSPRDYLYDAAFLVALAVKPEQQAAETGLLDRLREHLQNPTWPLYLGRKACVPSRPVLDRLTDEYQDLEMALRTDPWAGPGAGEEREVCKKSMQTPKLLAWIECSDGEYERQDSMRLNQLRFYGFRRCRRIDVDIVSLPRRIS